MDCFRTLAKEFRIPYPMERSKSMRGNMGRLDILQHPALHLLWGKAIQGRSIFFPMQKIIFLFYEKNRYILNVLLHSKAHPTDSIKCQTIHQKFFTASTKCNLGNLQAWRISYSSLNLPADSYANCRKFLNIVSTDWTAAPFETFNQQYCKSIVEGYSNRWNQNLILELLGDQSTSCQVESMFSEGVCCSILFPVNMRKRY